MKRTILSIFLSLLCFLSVIAHNSHEFMETIGGPEYEYGRSVHQTFDGGYIIGGITSSYGAGDDDYYLVKTDSMGNITWWKTYGGMNIEYGNCVEQTADSGYVMAGFTNSFGAGGYDMYLVKTNSYGDTLWTKTYGGSDWDFGYSVQQTQDGGYIIAGGTYSYGYGDEDVYLVKTNASGDTLWTRTYGGPLQDEARAVKQTQDGGYIVTGYTKSFGDSLGSVYLIRTNAIGDTIWTRRFGDTTMSIGNDVLQSMNGDFVVAGAINIPVDSATDAYILRTNSNGDSLWTVHYGGSAEDNANSIVETPSGDLTFLGTTYSYGGGYDDMYFFRMDANGGFVAATTFGQPSVLTHEEGYSIANTSDNGFILSGFTDGYGLNLPNVYLVKIDSMGHTNDSTATNPMLVPQLSYNNSTTCTAFPNPFRQETSVYVHSTNKITDPVLAVYDLEGRNVSSSVEIRKENKNSDGASFRLTNKGLSPGIYFLETIQQGKVITRSKLVVVQ